MCIVRCVKTLVDAMLKKTTRRPKKQKLSDYLYDAFYIIHYIKCYKTLYFKSQKDSWGGGVYWGTIIKCSNINNNRIIMIGITNHSIV